MAYQVELVLYQFQIAKFELPRVDHTNLVDKNTLSLNLLTCLKSCLSTNQNPIVIYMFMCAQAISIYGNKIMDYLGASSLLNYVHSVIESIYSSFYICGYQPPITGFNEQYDGYIKDVMLKIKSLWKCILQEIQEQISIWEQDSERYSLLHAHLVESYSTENSNTLIFIDSTVAGYNLTWKIKKAKILNKTELDIGINPLFYNQNFIQSPSMSSPKYNFEEFNKAAEEYIKLMPVPQGYYPQFSTQKYCEMLRMISAETHVINPIDPVIAKTAKD